MSYSVLSLNQGSQEWLDFRKQSFGASDCASMLGISPYKTRNQLLREKALGVTSTPNEYQQRLFTQGHEAEAQARALLSEELGIPLIPFVLKTDNSKLSASLDGADFGINFCIEHKLLSDSEHAQKRFELAKRNELLDYDMAQVQHQLLVSGAEYCLFVVSDGTADNRAIAKIYYSEAWFDRILEGWKQFEEDLDKYLQGNPEWLSYAETYIELCQKINELESQKDAVRKMLENMVEASGAQQMSGGGITLSRQTRKGSIDYAKYAEEKGLSTEELEQYRKPESSFYKISVGV